MKNHTFAKILKSNRHAAGYSQTEAADKLYVSRSAYMHYENGDRIPNAETLIRIAALYNVHPNDLLGTLMPPELVSDNPLFTDMLYCGKYAFSSEDLKVASYYNALHENEKEMVINLMRTLGSKQDAIRQTHLY